jgi:Ca-activated chloride channel family protein
MRDRNGKIIDSRLNEALLKQLAQQGKGIYRQADFRDADSRAVLKAAAAESGEATATNEKARIWNERFYWMLLPLLLLLLPAFRRSAPQGESA